MAFARGDARRCEHYLEQGLAASCADEPVRVALLVLAAQLTGWESDEEKSRAAAASALTAARAVGAFVADSELVTGQALFLAGSPMCLGHYRAAARVAAKECDHDLEFEARASDAGALFAFGDAAGAIASAAMLEHDADAAGKTRWARESEWRRARIEWLAGGAPEQAIATFKRLARRRVVGLHWPQLLGDLALALADAGEIDDARRRIRDASRAADTHWTRSVAAFYRAEIEWAAGKPQGALAAADEALEAGPPMLQAVTRGTRLWALFELGEPRPDESIDRLPSWPLLRGVRSENRAFRRLSAGAAAAAADDLSTAAGEWQGNVARCELRALWGRGELLARLGDRDAAIRLLTTVESRAQATGIVPILGRARRSLSQLEGGRRWHRHARLSARERETLDLVGKEMTTKKIAAALGISPRTVDSHIASAMSKLGATTRRQAAGLQHSGEVEPPQPAASRDERELVQLLAAGLSVSEAAAQLSISRRTASRRLRRIRLRTRFGMTTR